MEAHILYVWAVGANADPRYERCFVYKLSMAQVSHSFMWAPGPTDLG